MTKVTLRLCSAILLLLTISACGQPTSGTASPTTAAPAAAPAATATQAPTSAPQASPIAAGTPDLIKIVFSSAPDSTPDSLKLRVEQANNSACNGKFKIQYERWDNSDPNTGNRDAKKEAENAQKAISDPDVMVYLGPTYSSAAKISIPILNRAGLVMVSPAATLPSLTKPNTGSPGEPDVYYPTGKRNFARVIPSDDIQGVAAAVWAKKLGLDSIYILQENKDSYSKAIAQIFETKAKALGLNIVGNQSYNQDQAQYNDITAAITKANPKLLYFTGVNNLSIIIPAIRTAGYDGAIMGPDAFFDSALVKDIGTAAEGLYVTLGGADPKLLTGKGKQLYEDYLKAYNQEPEGYSPFYYDAMSVALAGIEKVCVKDRAAILDAIMGMKDFDGSIGKWSFDANGDTTIETMSGYQVKNGKFEFVSLLSE